MITAAEVAALRERVIEARAILTEVAEVLLAAAATGDLDALRQHAEKRTTKGES